MKYLIGILLAFGLSVTGLHSCGRDAPLLRLTGIVHAPCVQTVVVKQATPAVRAEITKKKIAHHFAKKKNHKKKFSYPHPRHHKSHSPHHHKFFSSSAGHTSSHSASHAAPLHLTGPPSCP